MCGRFTLRTPAARLVELFRAADVPTLSPRYNIAPTQLVLCVRSICDDPANREAVLMKWGLIPFWAKDESIGSRMINARSETAAQKPAFRKAFESRRCLIIADGFYEWEKLPGRKKQPWLMHLPDNEPFAFAGLWERWSPKSPDENVASEHPAEVTSCTILTTAANDDLRSMHDRMPVILPSETHDAWLSSHASRGQLQALMQPLADGVLSRYPVSSLVNRVANESPACAEPCDSPADSDSAAPDRPRQNSLFE
ncbi:MAG: SOS response-associated peptidase [Planctomycetaceae bacterium]